ncbi:MAG: helix-turn-helix domain-containing protein [Planctomycetales bacterium]|nr:helix-turn-helix domain-containing protein [Planctomycetales bacterium]
MEEKQSIDIQPLLTVKEVASWLNISASLVYQLADSGKLPVHRVGNGKGAIRFAANDITAYLTACRNQVTPKSSPTPKVRLQHIKLN